MKKQYFLNANIVDPANSIEELGVAVRMACLKIFCEK